MQAALTVSDQVVGWLKTTFADWINSHQSTVLKTQYPIAVTPSLFHCLRRT
jgi:hypothetical protein